MLCKILGRNSIESESGQVDCGNGKRAHSCSECKENGQSHQWCGGDCTWDELFEECEKKPDDNQEHSPDSYEIYEEN